jgi:uncharacterized protein (TIGR00725 family)
VNVAVIGKGRNCPISVWWDAVKVGRRLALLGVTVLTGGLGGVMDGAAYGCKAEGGVSIGLIPSDGTSEPSMWTTYAVRTGLPAVVRNTVLMAAADAVVALPGSHGAVQELALAVDRGLPLWRTGNHDGFLTGTLDVGFGHPVHVADLQAVVGRWLDEARVT